MSIYKPSKLTPDLQEINADVGKTTEFSCQVNTRGTSVKAYKMDIYTSENNAVLHKPATDLSTAVQNGNLLKTNLKFQESGITFNSEENITTYEDGQSVENGKDYQWKIRTYENSRGRANNEVPTTKVCSGYTTGSTTYVLWADKNDFLLYDKWVEIETNSSQSGQIYPIKEPNVDNITLPATFPYKERQQISWVDEEAGWKWNTTEGKWENTLCKITLKEKFKYNYVNGTKFKIYSCSGEHTMYSVFVGKGESGEIDDISLGYYVDFDNDASATAPTDNKHKITGWNLDSGEIRVGTAFATKPTDDQVAVIWKLDSTTSTWSQVVRARVGGQELDECTLIASGPIAQSQSTTVVYFDTEDQVDYTGCSITINNETRTIKAYCIGQGAATLNSALSSAPSNGDAYVIRKDNIEVKSGALSTTGFQLFVQPNVNILSDDTNPCQMRFAEEGVTINLNKKVSSTKIQNKETDITFETMDDSQWVYFGRASDVAEGWDNMKDVYIPKSNYVVYTDFMDSMPNGVFYARSYPTIKILFRELGTDEDYKIVNYNDTTSGWISNNCLWRDVQFKSTWSQDEHVEIKYYHYYLYHYNKYNQKVLIGESNDVYDELLEWSFKGLETGQAYNIELDVYDKYGSQFEVDSEFETFYTVASNSMPIVTEFVCEENAIRVGAAVPAYVVSEDTLTETTLTTDDVVQEGDSYLMSTMNDRILNYDDIKNADADSSDTEREMEIPPVFTYYTKFRLPYSSTNSGTQFWDDFNQEKVLFEIVHQNNKEFYLEEKNETLETALYRTYHIPVSDALIGKTLYMKIKSGSTDLLFETSTDTQSSEYSQVTYSDGVVTATQARANTTAIVTTLYFYTQAPKTTSVTPILVWKNQTNAAYPVYFSIYIDGVLKEEKSRIIAYSADTDADTYQITLEDEVESNSYANCQYQLFSFNPDKGEYVKISTGSSSDDELPGVDIGGDCYTVKVCPPDPYIVNQSKKTITVNKNVLKLKVYKNGTLLEDCFPSDDDVSADERASLITVSGVEYTPPSLVKYALGPAVVVDTLEEFNAVNSSAKTDGMIIIVNANMAVNNNLDLVSGNAYRWSSAKDAWENVVAGSVVLESKDYTTGEGISELSIPGDLVQDSVTLWKDANGTASYYWLPDDNELDDTVLSNLGKVQFTFTLSVDNSRSTRPVSCGLFRDGEVSAL